MANEGLAWQGLLRWSLSHCDGTQLARPVSEEDRKWFVEAMEAQTLDAVKRMREIALVMRTPEDVLVAHGVTPQNIEDMLDELQEHVEPIDMANDLHTVGGLIPLMGYLKNPHSGIRAKAAEVVNTIVQNNPTGQKLVLEGSGLESLLSNFASDPDLTAKTKALGAISSLIRHDRPAIAAFRLANGYAALREALGSGDVKFQRKALNLIGYLLHENKSDRSIVSELGFPRLMMHLASSTDMEVREAALGGLLDLAQDSGSGDKDALAVEGQLRQVLQHRIESISSMDFDDLRAAREERLLVDSLWSRCFNEPSSLREKGLLVLPGEDTPEPPPDVAGELFEPPLRAWAAAVSSATEHPISTSLKKDRTQLLPGPKKEDKPLLPGPENRPLLPSTEKKPLLPGTENRPLLCGPEKDVSLLPGTTKHKAALPSPEEKPLLPDPSKHSPRLPGPQHVDGSSIARNTSPGSESEHMES